MLKNLIFVLFLGVMATGCNDSKRSNVAPPLAFTTAAQLPDATVGVPYNKWIEVTGGVQPFTVNSGTLPDGLTISPGSLGGFLSGTPTIAGSLSFTVSVIDADTWIVSKDFVLDVKP